MEYKELVRKVIQENMDVLLKVDASEVDRLISEINKAGTIQLFAMGRMTASMRGFAMRLKHMGYDAYVVFDTTTPRIRKGDLLIINCGVTVVSLNIIKLAKEAGASVGVITAHPENEHGRLADFTVTVPGQIFGTGVELPSIQPMASLLEQSLFLFEDIVAMMMIEKFSINMKKMQERHTNLEGVMGNFA